MSHITSFTSIVSLCTNLEMPALLLVQKNMNPKIYKGSSDPDYVPFTSKWSKVHRFV